MFFHGVTSEQKWRRGSAERGVCRNSKKVREVKRRSNKMMCLKVGGLMLSVVSGYAPQIGGSRSEIFSPVPHDPLSFLRTPDSKN